MTKQETNILDKELRGMTARNIVTMVAITASVLGMAYKHYSGVMGKLSEMDKKLEAISITQRYQQQQIDRMEKTSLLSVK